MKPSERIEELAMLIKLDHGRYPTVEDYILAIAQYLDEQAELPQATEETKAHKEQREQLVTKMVEDGEEKLKTYGISMAEEKDPGTGKGEDE